MLCLCVFVLDDDTFAEEVLFVGGFGVGELDRVRLLFSREKELVMEGHEMAEGVAGCHFSADAGDCPVDFSGGALH